VKGRAMTFDLNEYAEAMRGRVARAKAGSEDAARVLLEEFVHNAGCFRHGDLQESDRIVLDFLVGAIRETLAGVDPRKALCLSSGEPGRRPRSALYRDVRLALDVLAELEGLRAGEDEFEGGATMQAQARIAERHGIKASRVRTAWENYGGEEDVRRLRDEFFPQWTKPNPKRI
jgi:hypothetical protein